MNKYKKAIMEISIFEVPPADNSCCYRMQGAVYKIKEIAEAALKQRRFSCTVESVIRVVSIMWRAASVSRAEMVPPQKSARAVGR